MAASQSASPPSRNTSYTIPLSEPFPAMAEVHIIGSIRGASGFPHPELTCKWAVLAGTEWQLVEGEGSGQTQVDLPLVGPERGPPLLPLMADPNQPTNQPTNQPNPNFHLTPPPCTLQDSRFTVWSHPIGRAGRGLVARPHSHTSQRNACPCTPPSPNRHPLRHAFPRGLAQVSASSLPTRRLWAERAM